MASKSSETVQKSRKVEEHNGHTTTISAGLEKLTSVSNMTCSVTLADPSLYDIPLIGCSEGFELLTGYSKSEIVGRNCRFLMDGPMEPKMRQALGSAISTGTEFIGILPNIKKNGERFRNVLRMTSVSVKGHRYIIGIQADVTDVDIDLTNANHLDDLRSVAERIFSSELDAWVQMQVHEFEVRLPIPSAQIVKNCTPEQYQEAVGRFLKIAGQRVHSKNTFLHVLDSPVDECSDFRRQKSASDPGLLPDERVNSSGSSQEEVPSTDTIEDSTQTYPNQTDSGDRENSEGSNSLVSSSDAGSQSSPGQLKSVGSAGHPDRCTECTFYFFGTQGCTKGSDCRFCHEFHPRKNLRKNRRFLKRLAVGGIVIPEEFTGDSSTHAPTLEPSTVTSASDDADVCLSDCKSSVQGSGSVSASATSGESAGNEIASKPPPYSFGTSAVMSLRYVMRGTTERQQDRFTLVVGQEVLLPIVVEMDSSAREALQDVLSFSVDPPLSNGLSFDPRNGLISGVATEVQEYKLHMVTASTAATGPCGIKLGLVPLARTPLLIRIVDLRSCKASSVYTIDDEDTDERILVEFKVPASTEVVRPGRSAKN